MKQSKIHFISPLLTIIYARLSISQHKITSKACLSLNLLDSVNQHDSFLGIDAKCTKPRSLMLALPFRETRNERKLDLQEFL